MILNCGGCQENCREVPKIPLKSKKSLVDAAWVKLWRSPFLVSYHHKVTPKISQNAKSLVNLEIFSVKLIELTSWKHYHYLSSSSSSSSLSSLIIYLVDSCWFHFGIAGKLFHHVSPSDVAPCGEDIQLNLGSKNSCPFHGYKRRVNVYFKKIIINPWMNWWPLHNNRVYDPTADYTHCIAMVFTSSNIFCIRFGDGLGWLHRIVSKVSSELQRRLSLLRTLLESPYN